MLYTIEHSTTFTYLMFMGFTAVHKLFFMLMWLLLLLLLCRRLCGWRLCAETILHAPQCLKSWLIDFWVCRATIEHQQQQARKWRRVKQIGQQAEKVCVCVQTRVHICFDLNRWDSSSAVCCKCFLVRSSLYYLIQMYQGRSSSSSSSSSWYQKKKKINLFIRCDEAQERKIPWRHEKCTSSVMLKWTCLA